MEMKTPRVAKEDWDTWEWHELDKIPHNLFPAAKNAIDSYVQKKITVSE